MELNITFTGFTGKHRWTPLVHIEIMGQILVIHDDLSQRQECQLTSLI